MSAEESFRDKTFLVTDPDARIRRDDNLAEFATWGAGEQPPGALDATKRIPKGTKVNVTEIRVMETGSESTRIFARATTPDGAVLGCTSSRNFAGRFVNETLGALPPQPHASRYGPNAAWSGGKYMGQVVLVRIVNTGLLVRQLAASTIEPYFEMVRAAAEDGILITLNRGFRSWPEQKYFHDGWVRKMPGFNRAAKPGTSKHQNGIACDLDVAGGNGEPDLRMAQDERHPLRLLQDSHRRTMALGVRPRDRNDARKGRRLQDKECRCLTRRPDFPHRKPG